MEVLALVSTTEYEVEVVYMDDRRELIRYGWGRAPENGVLHLYDVGGTDKSRSIPLANVRSYDVRRIR